MIKINNCVISYLEKSGNGLKLLLIHGNSNSKDVFKYVLESDKLSSFHIIALDLPGHGESEKDYKAVNCAKIYSASYYAEIIAIFIEKIKFGNPIVLGHSLGGHIAIHVSSLKSLSGLIISQTPPLEQYDDISRAFNPLPSLATLLTETITDKQIDELIQVCFPYRTPDIDIAKIVRNTDPLCRRNFFQSLTLNATFTEVTKINNLLCPVAIFESINDPIINHNYILSLNFPHVSLQIFERSGHFPFLDEAMLFIDRLREFCLKIPNQLNTHY